MDGTTGYSSNGTLIPTAQCTLQNCDISRSYFDSPPPLGPTVACIVYFGIFLVAQIFLGFWYRTWSFLAGVSSYLVLYLLSLVALIELNYNPFIQGWFSVQVKPLTHPQHGARIVREGVALTQAMAQICDNANHCANVLGSQLTSLR